MDELSPRTTEDKPKKKKKSAAVAEPDVDTLNSPAAAPVEKSEKKKKSKSKEVAPEDDPSTESVPVVAEKKSKTQDIELISADAPSKSKKSADSDSINDADADAEEPVKSKKSKSKLSEQRIESELDTQTVDETPAASKSKVKSKSAVAEKPASVTSKPGAPVTIASPRKAFDADSSKSTGLAEGQHFYESAAYSIQGRRDNMEDRHTIIADPTLNRYAHATDGNKRSFFGVFDGHGGVACAEYCHQYMHHNLINSSDFLRQPRKAMEKSVERTEEDFLDLAQTQSVLYNAGCTSITVLMVERELYVANVGDSRCVLSSRGKAINLSTDHKPDRQDEKRRIEALGGVVARTPEEADYLQSNFVQRRCMDLFYACCMPSSKPTYDGPSRIFPGAIAVSRTIGDIELKYSKLVSATPEMKFRPMEPEDEFFILACDGLWDVLTSQEAVDIVQAHKHLGATEAVRELVHTAYDAGSYDNISAIVVLLVKPPPGPPKDEVTVAMPAPTKFARQSTFLDSAKQK